MTRIERGCRRRIRGLLDAAGVREPGRVTRRLASRGSREAAAEGVREAVLERVGSPAVGLTEESDLRFLARSLSAFEAEVRGVFLGSDLGLLDRRVVLLGSVAALGVTSCERRLAQFRLIRDDLFLARRAAGWTGCGGERFGQPKGKVQDGTAHSRDEDFECNGCGGLLWEGTHWERIGRERGA